MKLFIVMSLSIFLVSCGKTEKVTEQKALELSGLQSSGVNLGAGSTYYGKVVFVSCESDGSSSNSQRLSQLTSFRSSIKKDSYEDFTIVGIKITPSQMISLLDEAISGLGPYSNSSQCPGQYLATISP